MWRCCLRWLAAALLLAACAAHADAVIDLSKWNPVDGPRALDGTWDFADGRLLGPGDAWPADAVPVAVPHEWSGEAGPRRGAGTYRATVLCDNTQPLALALTFQHSAARVWVDGQLVAEQGRPGLTPAQAEASVKQQILQLPASPCPMQVLVQVSNWDMYRGGFVRSVILGTPQQLAKRHEEIVLRVQTAQGALLFAALFGFAFWLRRRRETVALLFGVVALSIGMTLSLGGERAHGSLADYVSFDAFMRIVYLNWFLSLGTFPWVLQKLYPKEASRRIVWAVTVVAVAGGLFSSVTPAHVLTWTTPLLALGSVGVGSYIVAVLVRAALHRRQGALVLLAALSVFGLAVLNDILLFQRISDTQLMPYGILAFVLAPAVLMAQRFSKALAAEELRTLEQRERGDMLVRATKAGLLDWDGVAKTTTYSDRLKEMLGYAPGAQLPELRELMHPVERDRVDASFRRQLVDRSVKGGVRSADPIEFRLRRVDGDYAWVHGEGISVCDDTGRTLRFIASFIDISASKRFETELAQQVANAQQARQALALEQERLGLLVRSTKAGFGDWDAVRDAVTYTDRFKEMLGYEPGADTSTWPSIFEMMHPDDRDRARAQFREMIRHKAAGGEQTPGAPMSYRLQRCDGSYIWIHAEGIAQVDEHGRTTRFITSYLDVTKFHEQEAALLAQVELTRTEQRRLDLVVRGARVGIVDWDGVTHETYYSPRFREIRGYPADADTSEWPDYFKVMIHPEDRERITKRWVKFIRGQGPEGPRGEYYAPEEYRLLKADGGYTWVEVSGMAVRDDKGFVTRWIAAIIDITGRHDQREALRRQNETLRENVRLREEVERISRHDIKTPLNSIVAVPRLLREERKLGPEADELLGIVERAGYRILSMVNLSLDLFKMEQGTYAFRPDAVDVTDLLGKVIVDVRTHAASKHVQIRQVVRNVPYAWAEELLCYSLLANLLKNAVEASPEGAEVWVRPESRDGKVVLSIHNRGAVPHSIRETFFQKYASLGKASGTGLGTYSARLMARVQDGDVTMQTSDTQGTTLTVVLPAAPEGAMPATTRHVAQRRGVDPLLIASMPPTRVLLVDDDEYNLLIVRRFLPSPPFEVASAINGRVALGAMRANWPDLVFMDLDMPVMGGMEAVQAMREMERERAGAAPCRIVALSSHDDTETREQALAAGFDRYLTKPVTREAIEEMLVLLASPGIAPIRTRAAAQPPPASGAHDPVVIDPDMQDVLPQFMDSRRALIEAMLQAIGRDDRGEVRRIGHQMAGSFSLYGFAWASQQARAIEAQAADGDMRHLRALAEGLQSHIDAVQLRTPHGAIIETDGQHARGGAP
ncbi:MAG TPA: PAS domain-containing protein [Ramlibacter sp.]